MNAIQPFIKDTPSLPMRPRVNGRQHAWSDKILRTIMEGTAAVTGDTFFRSLVQNLACALQVRYAFVSQFTEGKTRVGTLAFWDGNKFLDNFEYDLAGTPCEQVLCGVLRHYPEDVQAFFPSDRDLVDLKAESYLAIPLISQSNEVLGHMAVLDVEPMPVEPREMFVFKIFAARATAELERKKTEKALKHRSDIEFIISTISTSFINLTPAEVDAAINHAMLTLGSFAEVDRCYVFLFSEDGKTFSNTHEWCAEGIEPQSAILQNLPEENYPWLMKQLKRLEVVHSPRVADLPWEARKLKEILEAQDIRSLIDVPISYGNRLIGFLGFDSVRNEKEWSDEDIRMLKLVGEIFMNALERRRADEELRKTQAQLIQSEKMAALGKLTAGIAHEINTPIGAVKSTLDIVTRCGHKIAEILERCNTLRELKANGDYRKAVKILAKNHHASTQAVERILDLLASLKNFTRLDEGEFKKAAIHEGIESTLTLMQHEIREGTHIIREYGKLPDVNCYPSELNQVFMTLLRNASQAIEQDGTIAIKTSTDYENVYIRISDTGKGIPPEKLGTLFELDFATKGSRIGMTMGLSNAYSIIQKHGGDIRVESEVGKGTEFTITLPLSGVSDC